MCRYKALLDDNAREYQAWEGNIIIVSLDDEIDIG